jgi:putative transposase
MEDSIHGWAIEMIMSYIAYKFRAYPKIGTQKRAIRTMLKMAEIWNAGLKERQDSFAASKENPEVKPINSYFKQYHLIRKREHPEFAGLDAQSMQDVLVKLDGSYKSFFQLIKKDPMARPPKEKHIHPVLVYRQSGWKIEGNVLIVRNIGEFKMRMHRPMTGTIKTVTVRVKNRKWFVCFSCELPDIQVPQKQGKEVTIRFEPDCFLTDGNRIVKHPEFYFKSIEKLRRLSRSLSRKQKGSKNRKRAKYLLAKHHEHIAAKRLYWLHDLANWYVSKYAVINLPKMPLKEKIMHATTSATARRLCDAA